MRLLILLLLTLVALITGTLSIQKKTAYKGQANHEPFVKDKCILFEETFEEQNPLATVHSTDFGTPYAFKVVAKPVFRGNKAGRFELRNSDPLVNNGKRAEITVAKLHDAKERWYSFAVYLPSEGFAKDKEQEVISQWHQSADKHLNEKAQSPATALRIKNDKFYLDTGANPDLISDGVKKETRDKIDLGLAEKDTWHEFVFHFIHSYKHDGLIEVWHNGKKVVDRQGGNMYNNVAMPKWKIGVYKAAFKHGRSTVSQRVLYFDNIRVGDKTASYTDMRPSN